MNHPESAAVPLAAVPRRRYVPVALTVCGGLALAVAVFILVRNREIRDVQVAFHGAAQDRCAAVDRVFQTKLAMLKLISSVMGGTAPVDRQAYHDLVQPFLAYAESVRAVEWVPRVSAAARPAFEASHRTTAAGFQITEMDSQGQTVRAAARSEYFPVIYAEPQDPDAAVSGFDVGSEPMRRAALCQARDTGKAAASGRIRFVENASDYGFLVVVPVYRRGVPLERVEDRRANLQGFVLGVLRPGDMLEWALRTFQAEGIDVSLHESAAPLDESLIHFHASRTRDAEKGIAEKGTGPFCAQHPLGRSGKRGLSPFLPPDDAADAATEMRHVAGLSVAEQQWSLVCAPTVEFVAQRRTWWPWGVLLSATALTAMLAAYLLMSIDRSVQVERLVQVRTRQLHEQDLLFLAKGEYTQRLEARVREQTAVIRRAQEETIQRLISASLWRDEETGMHIRRTGLMSEVLAKAAGWSDADVERIRLAAPMHDVGKIGIPDAVLRKPGQLTADEFGVMKRHTVIGARMLSGSDDPMLQMAEEIALNHHERWDGEGYPTGISGHAIPESARILAIVDVYDALTHDRVYRPAFPEEKVLTMMQQGGGTHFDPLLLAFFFSHLAEINSICQEHPDLAEAEQVAVL